VGSIEVLTIVIVIVFGALMIPILFDENPAAFLENSLCTIITPFGGNNFTCNSISGNVTFTGLNGIDIFANGTNQIIWNFTGSAGNGTGGGNQTDETHVSLGGDADIFKNETLSNANFRGVSAGIGINVTERTNDALIALIDCDNNELLLFNGTTDDFECIDGQTFAAEASIDNTEIFFAHLSATNADDVKVSFTNYDMRAVRFNDNVDVGATWSYTVPINFNSTGTTMEFKLFWFSQSSDVGDVCWQFKINDVVENDNLDFTLTQVDEICTANLGIDVLAVDTFQIPSTTHNFTANDLAWIQIHRQAKQNNNPNDTFEQNAYAIIGKLRWIA